MSAGETVAGALVRAAESPCSIRAIEHDGRSLVIPYDTLLTEAAA